MTIFSGRVSMVGSMKMILKNSIVLPTFTNSDLYYYYNPTTSYSGSGTVLADLSGNGRDATLVGNPSYDVSGDFFNFDGVDDYIVSPNMYNNSGNELHTIEIWAEIGLGELNIWSDLGNPVPTTSYYFSGSQIYTNGNSDTLVGNLWNGTGVSTAIAGEGNLRNQWLQIVRTYDGSLLKVYLNGEFANQTVVDFYPPWNDVGNNWFIAYGSREETQVLGTTATWFNGKYGIIRSYTRNLTDQEILNNYNSTKSIYGL